MAESGSADERFFATFARTVVRRARLPETPPDIGPEMTECIEAVRGIAQSTYQEPKLLLVRVDDEELAR